MSTVVNKNEKEIDFEAAIDLMDDDIREELHMQNLNDKQEFFKAYEEAHIKKYGEEWELSKSNPTW